MTDPPIYAELAAKRGFHLPDEVPALAGLDDRATLDAQSVAYRGMGPADIVGDGEIAAMAERIHPAYVPGGAPPPATGGEYEQVGWDRDRPTPPGGDG